MNNNLRMLLMAAFVVLASCHSHAWATDQIICNSATFRASFAVGSDGYVTYMQLQDKSAAYFTGVLEITDMQKDHRQVSIPYKAVDIKAVLGKKYHGTLVILVKNGNGTIQLGSRKEKISCAWDV